MLKLIVVAVVVVCVSSAVVPKPPATHVDVKHDTPSVKSTPLHPEQHSSTENHKPAEVKGDIKHDDKAKSSHDVKPDEKENSHHQQPTLKKAEHHNDHHAALKHHEVPVNVGHGGKAVTGNLEAHKSEKVENGNTKSSEHGH